MRNFYSWQLGVVIIFLVFTQSISAAEKFDVKTIKQVERNDLGKREQALRSILRLNPTAFQSQGVPTKIIDELNQLGCTIPQVNSRYLKHPNNIVSGDFAQKGQKDWAALCSRNGVSTVLIFWGGAHTCTSEIKPEKDEVVKTPDPDAFNGDEYVYSRILGAVNEEYITSHNSDPRMPVKPPPITHKGIYATGGTIVYCHKGKWFDLDGGD